MRIVFKSLCGLIVLGILIILAIPLAIGFWLQNHSQELANRFNIAPYASLKVDNFQRGWFCSKATLTWQLNSVTTQNGSPLAITSNETIYHGPFIITKDLRNQWQFYFAKALVRHEIQNVDGQLLGASIFNWDGSLQNIAQSAQLQLGQNHLVQLNGLHINIQMQPKNMTMIGDLSVDELKAQANAPTPAAPVTPTAPIALAANSATPAPITPTTATAPTANKQAAVEMQGIHLNFNIQRINSMWYGSRTLSANKIVLSANQQPLLTVNNLKLTNDASRGASTSIANATWQMDQVTMYDTTVGPISSQLTISNIDTAALENLSAAVDKMTSQNFTSQPQLLLALIQPASVLVSKGLVADLKQLTIGTTDGAITAQGRLNIPAQAGTVDPSQLLQKPQAQFDLSIPRAVLVKLIDNEHQKQAAKAATSPATPTTVTSAPAGDTEVQNWVNNQLFTVDGNNLKMHLEYANGQFTINGRVMSQIPSLENEHENAANTTVNTAPNATTPTPHVPTQVLPIPPHTTIVPVNPVPNDTPTTSIAPAKTGQVNSSAQ